MSLGYDPRPDLANWKGTPIPKVDTPLPLTPARERIARRVWWHGPPWTIVRNADNYVWRVIDYGREDGIRHELRHLDEEVWLHALEAAKPRGDLSRGGWLYWSLFFRRWNMAGYLKALDDWPSSAGMHIRDLRPLAHATRADLYRRQAIHHYLARGFCYACTRRMTDERERLGWSGNISSVPTPIHGQCCPGRQVGRGQGT